MLPPAHTPQAKSTLIYIQATRCSMETATIGQESLVMSFNTISSLKLCSQVLNGCFRMYQS